MRVEYLTDTDFKLFINSIIIRDINYDSKEELMTFLKEIMLKLKKIYGIYITGIYEVDIWVLKNVGIELIFNKKDDYTFSNKVIDLKMIIHLEPSVYLKFDNYDYIEKYKFVRVHDDNFYLDVRLLDDKDILLLSDFYKVVHDDEIDDYDNIKS